MQDAPWKSCNEWQTVHDRLWSKTDAEIHLALKQIHNWSLTSVLPFEIEVTALLKKAELKMREEKLDWLSVEALYASAVIRLTAAVKDNPSVLKIRPNSELPVSIAQCRNDFVHGIKPSFQHFRFVGAIALDFLKTQYWDYQMECLPREAAVIQSIVKYFRRYKELEDMKSSQDVDRKAGILLKTIQEMIDPLSLIDILLRDLNIHHGSTGASRWFSKGLKKMSVSFSCLWPLYLVEKYLEKVMTEIQNTESLDKVKDLEQWCGALCSMVCPNKNKLDSTERDRIIQKFFITIQHLKTFHLDSSGGKASFESFLNALESLLDWLLRLCSKKDTKIKLKIVFEEVIKSSSGSPLALVEREKESHGVFHGLKNWESAKLGSLPFNYNPLHF